MTDRHLDMGHRGADAATPRDQSAPQSPHEHPEQGGAPRWGHHLMMLACCIPMLVVVGVLVATGVAGAGAIVYALICTAMMAGMMFFMPGHKH